MAQEFVIRLWCDRHAMTDERVQATSSVPLSLPGYPDRVIDVCDDCHAFLFADLLEVVGKNGRPSGDGREQAARRTAGAPTTAVQPTLDEHGDVRCPICLQFYETGKALMTHYRNTHTKKYGVSLVDLYGNDCPICGVVDSGNLGVHANRVHGSSGVAGAFATAERAGDEFGVVEEFRARVVELRRKVGTS